MSFFSWLQKIIKNIKPPIPQRALTPEEIEELRKKGTLNELVNQGEQK